MNVNTIRQTVRPALTLFSRNAPHILTGVAVAGVAGTSVAAFRAAVPVRDRLHDLPEEATIRDKVRATWKLYIPAAVLGAATISCIVAANVISSRRRAALAAAYSLAAEAVTHYREDLRNLTDEATLEESDQLLARKQNPDKVYQGPAKETFVVGDGKFLCYDTYSGRYFNSSLEEIKKCVNDINFDLIQGNPVSLNDFYSLVGLDQNAMGDQLGWTIHSKCEIDYMGLLTTDGKPTVGIRFKEEPTSDWWKVS